MPIVTLTAKSVLTLPVRGARVDYFDQKVTGLLLRVTPRARTYCVWYRVNGVPRRFTLGPTDEVDLADARAQALEIRRQARSGVDAVVAKHAAVAEAQKAKLVGETLADLAERYLEAAGIGDGMKRGEPLAPRTVTEYDRTLTADVLLAIGDVPPGDVTKAHIRSLVDSIRAKGHAVQANRVPSVLNSIFSWALRKDVIASSPCTGLQSPREHPRERVYSDAELRAIVSVAGTELEHLFPLILFTATRRRRRARPGGQTWTSSDGSGRSRTSSRAGSTYSRSAAAR